MARILSFDPGRTTGCVAVSSINYAECTYTITGYKAIEWTSRSSILELLQRFKDMGDLDAIVIEDFRLFPNKALDQAYDEFPSSKVIERITVYAELLGIDNLIVMQMPSLRHNVKLPVAEHKAIPNKHCIAAMLHARYYIRVSKSKGAVQTT
jgi:L-fucose mutarotase/ribose pyranase (RbsD/FucU family)